MTETATPEAPTETPEVAPAEANLTPAEQESLRVAREGLPPVDPSAKPDNRPQRPESIPEKFWDAEKGEVRLDALTQSYAALEAKLSGKPEEAAEEAPAEGDDVEVKNGKIVKKEGEEAPEEAEDATPELTSIIQSAAAEFTDAGAFTPETSEALAKAGIPPEVQQVYLAGLEALQRQQTEAVHSYVGGESEYEAMAKWAGRNLSDEELEAFNAALDNKALAQNAVVGLYARYQKANPSEGKKIAPVNNATGQSDTFASRRELIDAQSDPRYRTDAKYQREVVEKLARTRAAGIKF